MCNINEITAAREVLMSVTQKADMVVAGTAGEGSRAGAGVAEAHLTLSYDLKAFCLSSRPFSQFMPNKAKSFPLMGSFYAIERRRDRTRGEEKGQIKGNLRGHVFHVN
jgi:hypothetical protein